MRNNLNRKNFIVRCDERNHVFFTRPFIVCDSVNDIPLMEIKDDHAVKKIDSDPEDQSASDYDLYKITFKDESSDYYALPHDYPRDARVKIYDECVTISIMEFSENGYNPEIFDFHPADYLGCEWETIEDLKQVMYDYCRDQLDSVFGLMSEDDYQTIYDGIDKWLEESQSKLAIEDEIERIENNPSLF